MKEGWYVLNGNREVGPFPLKQIQSLAARGKLKPHNLLRQGESGEWREASELPGLFAAPRQFPLPSGTVPPAGTVPTEPPQVMLVPIPPPPAAAPPQPAPPPAAATPAASPTATVPAQSRLAMAGIVGGAVLLTTVLTAVVCMMLLRPPAQDPSRTDGPQQLAQASNPEPSSEDSFLPQPERDRTDMTATASATEPAASAPTVADSASPEPGQSEPDIARATTPEPDPTAEPQETSRQKTVSRPPAKGLTDVEPLLPPIPEEKVAISDSEIREFERELKRERRARHAFARYEIFSQSFAFTPEQQNDIEINLAEWKQRSEANLFRLGSDWVPRDEVIEAEKAADLLIDRAAALISVGNFEGCIEQLEDANRANPNSVKAPYLLGLMWSLPIVGLNGPNEAEKSFRVVLARHPDHAAAHNSLAITQIKQGEHSAALRNLSEAARLSDVCPEVVQNLGRFVHLVEAGRMRTSPAILRRYADLYAELIGTRQGQKFNPKLGWLHMLPVFPTSERERTDDRPTARVGQKGETLVPMFSGSGFAVAPGYVMTNRHVAVDASLGVADSIGIPAPGRPGKELHGTVVAVSDEVDLALIHFPQLAAKPLPLHPQTIDLASDVLILGFPRGDVLGTGMKATQGVITGLPDPTRQGELGRYYIFDATSDQGNSGGPVFDRSGRVVGVLTFLYREGANIVSQGVVSQGIDAELSGGVTSESAHAFATAHIPDLVPGSLPETEFKDWAELTRSVSSSVFRLTVYYRAGLPQLQAAARKSKVRRGAMEDYTCPSCNGRSRVNCTQRDCRRGQVTIKYTMKRVIGVGPSQRVMQVPAFRKEQCSRCEGEGTLDCPDCVEGIDISLLK